MLKFNVKRILALRGIEKRPSFLVKHGFTYQQATRFLRHANPILKVKHIEALCVALNCTPNDLFEWKADTNTVLPEMHSLNALNRGERTPSVRQMLKDIPSDKLELIEKLFEELKK